MKDKLKISEVRLLLFSVFVLSLCGIIYELVLGSLAAYLLGNPVQQYSITIGVFLSSMGLGSYLSRFLRKDLLKDFIIIEAALGFAGGVSVLILSYLFSFSPYYFLLHLFFLIIIGALVGLEIPLITRIIKKYGPFKNIISNVLTLDYMGGLAGAVLFPLVLFPFIGRLLTGITVGIINIIIALLLIRRIDYSGKRKSDYMLPLLALIILFILAFNSDTITGFLQKRLYYDDIVFSKRSEFQEIVLTRNGGDFRLYLDGSLQFSTFDEYRYHEMLIHPAMTINRSRIKEILILGGGDGIAAREVLKYGNVKNITLVELDPVIIELARSNSSMKMINGNSLNNAGVKVIIGDAFSFLAKNRKSYDVIVADFPDPHDETITKLYTVEFFGFVKRSLRRGGIFITQSTSPLFAREAFWCINKTLRKVFKTVIPYHIYIPTFGDWGFNLASPDNLDIKEIKIENKTKYLFFSKETFLNSMHFPEDTKADLVEINTFNRPVLYGYYLKGWKTTDY